MDWLFKALLVAGSVWLVMAVARRGGRRVAGMTAGLPTITAPTLAWLAHEEGVPFAVNAAIGSVAACAMLAAFALAYARAAHCGRGAAIALVCGLGGALVMAFPADLLSVHLTDSLALALVSCAVALAAMPGLDVDVLSARRSPRAMFLVAVAAGGLTALVATFGTAVGAFAAGVLSSLPLISGSVAMVEHTVCGHRAASHFLRGYVGGLWGKAAFGVVFALLAPRIGVAGALLIACASACAMSAARAWPALVLAALLPARTWRRSE